MTQVHTARVHSTEWVRTQRGVTITGQRGITAQGDHKQKHTNGHELEIKFMKNSNLGS